MARDSFKIFKETIWEHYHKHKRALPWRNTRDPYHILVSEIMLQQTQVSRVLQKYPLFIAHFPTIRSLAKAPLKTVLIHWQGMGYNRRALHLKQIAETLMKDYNGNVPDDPSILRQLPGIGKATARSIVTFAFNIPTVFIETNIRRVFIHFFFPKDMNISDRQIAPLIEKTLDRNNPREWYFALMDYSTTLAKKIPNPNTKSKHYTKQSKFEGSNRQLRGMIVKELLKNSSLNAKQLIKNLGGHTNTRIEKNLQALVNEGIIKKQNDLYTIE